MKRIGEYFAGAYKNAFARWIFGITASLVILPDLIKTVLLCIKKESLAAGTVFIADVLCVVCAFVFAFFAVCSIGKTAKEAVAVWLKGCIPCIAALYGGKLLTVLFVKCFGTVGEFVGIATGGILLGLSFYLLSCAVNSGIKRKVGRKLLLTAVCILLAIVFAYLLPYILGLGIESAFVQKRVWCIKLIVELVYAVFCQALIVPVLKFVCLGNLSKAGTDEQITSAQTKKSRLGYIPTAVVAAVLTICAVMTFPATVSPSDRLKAEYYSRTNTACYNLLGGHIITAVNDYREIQRELEIWKEIADGGWNDISESEIATNQMLAYLDTYANHTDDRLETMEKYYTAGYIKDTDFCFDMLTEYKNADELTAEQKNRRTEILTNLADSVGTCITYQLVSQAVEKALESPEDFVWSYIAVMFYNNQEQHSLYLTADYSDDKRILAVVENFEKQFEKQLGKDITKEERLGIKKLVMQTYLRALALDKCADYGLEALKEFDNFFIRENTMYALLKTGRYDECLKLANEVKDDTNPVPLYYAAASTLESGEFDASAEYVLKLAKQVKTSEYPKIADELLHSYFSLLVVDTETTKAKYSLLSDEQINKLNSDEFLKNYLAAYVNACYPSYGGHSIYDDAYTQAMETALAAADQVIAERGELCYPYYLKGVTLMQQKKYDEAVAAYKKAIDYKSDDPMIWYALYAAYEELEEWENAYTAAEIAIGLSPWFNYYSDYEGIGIHPYSYREGAKAMIEKQHEASQKGGNE